MLEGGGFRDCRKDLGTFVVRGVELEGAYTAMRRVLKMLHFFGVGYDERVVDYAEAHGDVRRYAGDVCCAKGSKIQAEEADHESSL